MGKGHTLHLEPENIACQPLALAEQFMYTDIVSPDATHILPETQRMAV